MADEQTPPPPPPAPEPAAAAPPPPDGEITQDARTMAMLAHLLGIFTGFLGPLIIWLIKKDESSFVDEQGKEALNFQITVVIASFIAGATVVIFIGCILAPAVVIADIVFCVIAALAANKGEHYRYPLTIRFIK